MRESPVIALHVPPEPGRTTVGGLPTIVILFTMSKKYPGPLMTTNLGELEQLVLLALVRLGDEAYGVTVHEALRARTGRVLSFATVYTTLGRLEAKGLVASFVGEPTRERGGRAKKHFTLTASGRAALKRSLGDLRSMTQGLGASWGGVA